MVKVQLLSSKIIFGLISLMIFGGCSSPKKDETKVAIFYSDPFLELLKKKGIKELSVFKVDSLNTLDTNTMRKYTFDNLGNVVQFEDVPAFSTHIKIKYSITNNVPNEFVLTSDIESRYSGDIRVDSVNNKLTAYWKDEFNSIADSSQYEFNSAGQITRIKNNLNFFNHFIRRKMGLGVFRIKFDEDLSYDKDSILESRLIKFRGLKENEGYEKIFPENAAIKYYYSSSGELEKIVEQYNFQDKSLGFTKEIFFKGGVPDYHIINGKEKYRYVGK